MKEIIKICRKHGELIKDQVELEAPTKTGYRNLRCKQCRLEKNARWKVKNRKKNVEYSMKWKQENKEKYNQWIEQDKLANPEKYKYYNETRNLRSLRNVIGSHGLELDNYYEMVKKQNNTCAICLRAETRKKSRSETETCRLTIDHCHKTGKIRGLLCHNCNTGIGKFKDNISLMQEAIEYLKKHQKDLICDG